jgi:polysaccharide biosynthesis transport protein
MPQERLDRNLPAVIPVSDTLRIPYQQNGHAPGWDPEPEEPAVPLSHYLWIVKRHRWKILAFVAACVISTLIVSLRLTPIYESTAVIDIDRRMPTGILGQEATQSATNDADQFLATQIKLIQADAVLRPVALKYKLRELENDDWDKRRLKDAEAEDTPVILKKLKVTRPPNTYILLISYQSPDKR